MRQRVLAALMAAAGVARAMTMAATVPASAAVMSASSRVAASAGGWANAALLPGAGKLGQGGADGLAVSCPSTGNCTAGGGYFQGDDSQVFVISERNGRWGNAEELPGLSALSTGDASVGSVSCASPGNCVTGGSYRDAAGHTQAFLAAQKNGHWNKAGQARGTAALNAGGSAQVTAMSCPSAGHCVGVGYGSSAAPTEEALYLRRT